MPRCTTPLKQTGYDVGSVGANGGGGFRVGFFEQVPVSVSDLGDEKGRMRIP